MHAADPTATERRQTGNANGEHAQDAETALCALLIVIDAHAPGLHARVGARRLAAHNGKHTEHPALARDTKPQMGSSASRRGPQPERARSDGASGMSRARHVRAPETRTRTTRSTAAL
jgi:hypothetical protein